MTDEAYIPVNKGHFELDTPERIEQFQEKMATGWKPQEYMEYRHAWENLPQKKMVRNYPLQVDLELSSKCNLHCPMCYTRTEAFRKHVNRTFMPFDLFKRVVDEVAGKVYAIRLSWRGESSLHPQFIEAIAYAKEKGVKEVSFLTNGSLSLDLFKKVVDAGVDWVTVSIDGINETYENVRKPLKFEDTLSKIVAVKRYKSEKNLTKPAIKIQSIWPAVRDNAEEYYNLFYPYVDLTAFNPIIDYLGLDSDIVYEENFSCPQLYERVFVASNGDVMMCNSDEYGLQVIGNAFDQTIHQIWHGDKLTRIRQIHKMKGGFKTLEICRKCFYPRKTEVNEKAVVNGRNILIENYVNRKQTIGE